jgi:predicted RNase H-like nuclease
MGLLDAVDLRPCDRQARNLLGRARQSTVFAPPSRPLLAAGGDYGRARELIAEERLTSAAGKGLSAQAAGLIPKIAEVDELFRADPDRQGWLFECHPELSFPALSGGRTLDDKRTPHGQAERLQLLAAKFADLLEVIAATRIPSQHPDLTDVLDGYAALTTALVVRAGEQRELGGELDSVGVLMRMVC